MNDSSDPSDPVGGVTSPQAAPNPAPGASSNAGAAPTGPATGPAKAAPDRAIFFAALGNPLRWRMVKMMAAGQVLSASAVAKAVQREFDGVSKHLRMLLKAKVIALRPGGDRRYAMYYIPDQVRRADGVLDYGFCVIRIE